MSKILTQGIGPLIAKPNNEAKCCLLTNRFFAYNWFDYTKEFELMQLEDIYNKTQHFYLVQYLNHSLMK